MFDKSDRSYLLKLALYAVGVSLPMWYLLAVRRPTHLDYIFHSLVLENVSKQLWSGDLYPRWLMGLNAGLGSPVFLFQPPLAYFSSALFQWLAPYDSVGLGRFIIIAALSFFGSGCFCYRWLREFFDKKAARYGAAIYITFPHFIFLFYGLPALPMLWGAMCFPLLLWMAALLIRDPFRYGWCYALVQGVLVMVHLPSALMMSPVVWLYAIVIAPSKQKQKIFCIVSLAAALGMMLGAICWVVFLSNLPNVLFSEATHGYLDYQRSFIRLFIPQDQAWFINLTIKTVLYTFTPLALYYWEIRKLKPFEHNKTQVVFWLAVSACAMFMMFPIAKIVWQTIPMVAYVQYSLRFILLPFAAVAFICANWLPKLRHVYLYFVLAIIGGIGTFTEYANGYTPTPSPILQKALTYQLLPWNHYITVWMQKAGVQDILNPPARFLNMPSYQTAQGNAEITNIQQEPRSFTFHAHVISPSALITLHRYYYPGWVLSETAHTGISVTEHDALLAVNLPIGDYDVEIRQPWFPGEKLGDLLSVAGFVIVLVWAASVPYFRKKPIMQDQS